MNSEQECSKTPVRLQKARLHCFLHLPAVMDTGYEKVDKNQRSGKAVSGTMDATYTKTNIYNIKPIRECKDRGILWTGGSFSL
jgi:hypothetical protein